PPPAPKPDDRITTTARIAIYTKLPSRQIRTRWSRVMRLVSPPCSGRNRTRVVTPPRRAVKCRWISMREPMSTWPKPADIVGRSPWTMYVSLSTYQARAIPPPHTIARRTSTRGHAAPRRSGRPRDANAVAAIGRPGKRTAKAGTAARGGGGAFAVGEEPPPDGGRSRRGARGYGTPSARSAASGAARIPMAVVGSAALTVVPRPAPNPNPDGRKIRMRARYARGPKRPRNA